VVESVISLKNSWTRTSLGKVYTTTWKVTLKKGTYKFVCDPHAAIMKGTLKVT
jgi:plastocyanin